jgi:hypothetical protein
VTKLSLFGWESLVALDGPLAACLCLAATGGWPGWVLARALRVSGLPSP